jgi:hypothetical protein
VDGKHWTVRKEDIEFWVSVGEREHHRPWMRYFERLKEANIADEFLSIKRFDARTSSKFSDLLRFPVAALQRLQQDILSDIGGGLSSEVRETTKQIEETIKERIVFFADVPQN